MEESMDQVTSLPAAKGSSSSMLQSCLDENSNDSWMQREDYTVDSIVTYRYFLAVRSQWSSIYGIQSHLKF
jgi:hypothetical protein